MAFTSAVPLLLTLNSVVLVRESLPLPFPLSVTKSLRLSRRRSMAYSTVSIEKGTPEAQRPNAFLLESSSSSSIRAPFKKMIHDAQEAADCGGKFKEDVWSRPGGGGGISRLMSKMEDLPKELVIPILLHLPAEDLVRCKSVCKALYSIITSRPFIDVCRKIRNSYILVKYEEDPINRHHAISLLSDETLEIIDTQPVFDISNENIVSLEPVVKYDNGGTNESGHAMVIVGQGQNEYYEKYWHVKNTWGEGWGDEGYARLAKSVLDPNRAYYPIYYPLIHED
ncbi:hypothetical protein FEM48_Zijuj02G0209200 [Ziziphus jujuba var. spinosa]|uniref:F-box domain-containing protein n=1 Tax=Ziziphus jujuba var. spinosa TaxID=714518 RepID=A0A978VXW8_ZIZJJ|nr:hypothetical protein FEM48_Zijuj02G0209200 [Ziziphus jujuba var. spinosa]